MSTDPNHSETSTHRLGKGMTLVAWLLVLGLFTLFFSHWLDGQRNPNQEVTSQTLTNGVHEVVLRQNRYGHYVATGKIDGQAVEFMVDTGATAVSVPASLAQQLGLRRGAPLTTITANGAITTYATILNSVQLGDIVLRDISASINPKSDEVLLGMSFLKQLEFTQRGDTLTLRQY